ncbi:hypothetical protein R4J98_30025, partial [Pseudomonas aeruginosa]|nr:hypothetical protein [Pseudomonas aeruginosa]
LGQVLTVLKLETSMCELAYADAQEGLRERLGNMKKLIAQLFQQNYNWLCKKLSYQTGCSHSVEDLAAEAFLQVWMLP